MRSRSDESDALIESAFDHQLRAALDVDPSPEFLARVRVRLAAAHEPSGWRRAWLFAIAGAIAVIVVAAVVTSRSDQGAVRSGVDVSLPPEWAVGTSVDAPPQDYRAAAAGAAVSGRRTELPVAGRRPRAPVAHGVRPAATSSRRHPDVLLSADEIRGLRRLIAMANAQDANLGALLAGPMILATVGPEGEITVPPISIDPLVLDIDSTY
jgi:hypothetical protein